MTGFIGLGIMGKPMAKHLLAKLGELAVYDLQEGPVKELTDLGAVYKTPAEMAKDCEARADVRAANTAVEAMRSTVTGYGAVAERSRRTTVHREKTEYAMMPVWMLHTKWNGKDFWALILISRRKRGERRCQMI